MGESGWRASPGGVGGRNPRTVELAINLRDKIEICIYTVLNANEVGNLLGDALSRNEAKSVCVCAFFLGIFTPFQSLRRERKNTCEVCEMSHFACR